MIQAKFIDSRPQFYFLANIKLFSSNLFSHPYLRKSSFNKTGLKAHSDTTNTQQSMYLGMLGCINANNGGSIEPSK